MGAGALLLSRDELVGRSLAFSFKFRIPDRRRVLGPRVRKPRNYPNI